MPILRQYSLPNCILRLEGLSHAADASAPQGGSRSELQVLTRLECSFEKEKQTLVGGRDLLEGLIQATNDCAQGIISGLPSVHRNGTTALTGVQLHADSEGWYDLKVSPSLLLEHATTASGAKPVSAPEEGVHLRLSSVQIFDLMEAIDQLLSDQQTLPDLKLAIRPRSRKDVQSDPSTQQQTTPLILGTASMVAAAIALFFAPVPKVPVPTQTETPSISQPGAPAVSPVPGVSPTSASTALPVSPTPASEATASPVPPTTTPTSP